jgi:hypothetical protein
MSCLINGLTSLGTRIDFTTPYRGDATDFAGILEQQRGIKVFFLLRKRGNEPGSEGWRRDVGAVRGWFSIVILRERFVR